jgi:hypothetical protein
MQIIIVPSLSKLKGVFFAYLIMAFVQVFICCGNIPSQVMEPPKMSKVLFSVLEHDEFVNTFALKDSTINKMTTHLAAYKTALDSSNCTPESFERSFKWYQEHPVLFKIVLDSVNSIINKKRAEKYQIKSVITNEQSANGTDSLPKLIDINDTLKATEKARQIINKKNKLQRITALPE